MQGSQPSTQSYRKQYMEGKRKMTPIDRTKDTDHIRQVRHDIDVAACHLQNAANVAENGKLPAYMALQIQMMIVQIDGLEHILQRMSKPPVE